MEAMTTNEDTRWTVPGRYDFPPLHVEPSINYEVVVEMGAEEGFLNAFDLLEVALAAAWSVSPEETTAILTRSRTHGFSNPRVGPQ